MYRVVFPFELKLGSTSAEDGPDGADAAYQLFAVIVHVGSGLDHGETRAQDFGNQIEHCRSVVLQESTSVEDGLDGADAAYQLFAVIVHVGSGPDHGETGTARVAVTAANRVCTHHGRGRLL